MSGRIFSYGAWLSQFGAAFVLSLILSAKAAMAGPDVFEPDNTSATASEYLLSESTTATVQYHNFDSAADVDWIRFHAIGGRPYTLKIQNAGADCDAVIELWDENAVSLLSGPVDNNGPGQQEQMSWSCPAMGNYLWRVSFAQDATYGGQTSYTVELTENSGANNGLASVFNTSRVDCSWDPSPDPTIQGYILQRTQDFFSWTTLTPTPIQTLSYSDNAIQNGTTYYYLVRIRTQSGGEPQLWAITSATTPVPVTVSGFDIE